MDSVQPLPSPNLTAERLRETVQAIAAALLGKMTIPTVAQQAVLIESMAGDEWWVEVTLPMLELARVRLRGLVRFVDKTHRNPVYTDFIEQLGDATTVDLPGITSGTDFARFRAKAAAYLLQHEDHVALQRLRRNKQLTAADLKSLEDMLIAAGIEQESIDQAAERTGGLGLFIRSLVGLDRPAVLEAFEKYLDDQTFTINQVRFINLIVDELTTNGVMEPRRLFKSPFTDSAPTGAGFHFPTGDLDVIVGILHDFTLHASPDPDADEGIPSRRPHPLTSDLLRRLPGGDLPGHQPG